MLFTVSADPDLGVWMVDGKNWEKSSAEVGHRMNFQGFDENNDILLCSWGRTYTVPKEFYENLEFVVIKINKKINEKTR